MVRIIISMLLLLSTNGFAGVVDDGLVEYHKGNYVEAHALYKQGCESGDANGCLNLGVMYYIGKSVETNPKKAKKLFLKACKKGNGKACFYIGTIYKRGADGIERNTKLSKKFYGHGCAFAYSASCDQYFLIKDKNDVKGSGNNAVDMGYTYSRPDVYGG